MALRKFRQIAVMIAIMAAALAPLTANGAQAAESKCRFPLGQTFHLDSGGFAVLTSLDQARLSLILSEFQANRAENGTAAASLEADKSCRIRLVAEPGGPEAEDQGFRITRTESGFDLAARSSLGHLYAVWELLQQLGFTWISDSDTARPADLDWGRIAAETSVSRPRFALRGMWTWGKTSAQYRLFLARNKLNLIGGANDLSPDFAVLGISQWGGTHELARFRGQVDRVFVAIGNNRVREQLHEHCLLYTSPSPRD